jgi:AcrR family transcriptional regulator
MPYAVIATTLLTMTTDSSGSGDPAQTIALLWGTRQLPRRGPRHGLTSDQIVAAATTIADADKDLAPLSMRRVAESLGVGTMSLYTYVSSRAELVEAMLDRAYGEAVRELEAVDKADWRAGLRGIAAVNWTMYLRHPWMLQVFTGRPPLGPNAIAKYDLELRAVEGIGLGDVEMDAVITLVHTHVEGVARRKIEAARVAQQTGITDEQWWELAGPALAEVYEPGRFPVADRVGQAAGQAHQAAHDPEHEYVFGLDRLIAGVAALISIGEQQHRK